MNNMEYEILEFLRESNNIEDVWDDVSLEQAIIAWQYLMEQTELTPSVVKKTHKILMLHQGLLPNEKGYFREVEVMIGGRMGRPHYAVPALMDEWCKRANETVNNIFAHAIPLIEAEERMKQDHIAYETIHPFVDGNGRTGRMFFQWQRQKLGLSVKVFEEKHKEDYYGWFE